MWRTMVATRCILLLGVLATASAAEPARPLVVGHRGLMQAAPECTLAGFRACLALRVGFEFDVRRCRDGELICLHDPTLDRTTSAHGPINSLTFEQARQLDAGSRFDPAFRGERIPRIEDIFALAAAEARGDVLLAVDLKESGDGLEEKVVRLAEKHKILDRLLFIGLTIESPEVRSRLHTANRHARTARLAATPEEISAVLVDRDADWVYVRHLPSRDDMTRIHAAGKRVFMAGPLVAGEEKDNWAQAAALGIDAVLTDFPIELVRQLRTK
jgi:glycerophosphoryl diester phosphodiesterase